MSDKKNRVVTAHVPEDLVERVEKFAARQDRSKGWIVRQALEARVSQEEEIERRIEEGLADIDAGRTHSHDEVAAWLLSLKAGAPQSSPRAKDES
jgi:predicted transcriptional regulator